MMDPTLIYADSLMCERTYTELATVVGAHAFCLDSKPGEIRVAVRGTETPAEIWEDFEALPTETTGFPGLIHYGFATAFSEVWPAVYAAMPPRQGKVKLRLTGHSLGAALAALMAWHITNLMADAFEVASVTLFGCPRVGNQVWAASFTTAKIPCVRVWNHRDLVPLLPPAGFWHVGELSWLDAQGRSHDTVPFADIVIPTVEDHHMPRYVAACSRWAGMGVAA